MQKKTKASPRTFAQQALKLSFAHIILMGLFAASSQAFAEDAKKQDEQEAAPVAGVINAPASTPIQTPTSRAAYSESLSMPLPTVPAKAEKSETDAVKGGTEETADDMGPSLLVSGVQFVGNSVYSQETLGALVAGDINKKLTFKQLQALAAKVENYYHENGYQLVRVIIPKQDAKDGGVLLVRVLEGTLGKINVTGNKRYSTERVLSTMGVHVEEGKPFTMSEVERPLMLMNNRSGITASSTLAPGAETGSTDIDIEIKEARRVSGSLEFNNFGSDDSGEYRLIPAISFQNLTGAGDELSAFAALSLDALDTWSYQVSYVRPIGPYGTSASVYFGQGNNEVGNEYAILDINGDSLSWGAGLSHRIVWSARTSLELQAWFEWQDTRQDMLGIKTADDNIRKIRVGANFDHIDSWGRTFLSAHVHQGLGDVLGGMDNDDPMSSRAYAHADNRFTKFVLGLMRVQSFHPRLYALFNVTGQISLDPLVAGEQIYAGGANTVRGQPQSYASGDDGVLINTELRFAVLPDTSRLQLAAFFDYGEVHVKTPIIGQKDWTSLMGAGVGFRAEVIKGLDIRFDVALPVGAQRGDSCYLYGQARYSF